MKPPVLSDILAGLHAALLEIAPSLGKHAIEVAEHVAQRSQRLATMINDKDFEVAFRAERRAALLFAASKLTDDADMGDSLTLRNVSLIMRVAVGAMVSL